MHGRKLPRTRLVPVLVALLLTAHVVVLYRISSHAALGMTAVLAVGVLVLVKHLGLLKP